MNTKYLRLCAILISTICLVSSCLDSDEATTTTYEDTAITAFTLGTVKVNRYIGKKKYDKDADGNPVDSFYTYSYTGSNTPVYIDHLSKEIYNTDSLPAGSYMKMLATVTSKNSATMTYRDWDAADDAAWTVYSSSDSITFVNDEGEAKSLRFRVWASDGSSTRDYKVDIVCHKEYADSFQYVALAGQSFFADATSLKATATSEGLYVLAANGTESLLYKGTDLGSTWTQAGAYGSNATIASDDDDNIYILDGGTLYYGDGTSMQTADVTGYTLSTLAGTCKDEIYAMNGDGKMMVAKTSDLATWTEDATYSDSELLPVKDICSAAVIQKTNADVSRITIVGNKASYTEAGDTCAIVWNKNVNTTTAENWIYNDPTEAKTKNCTLPAMSNLSATGYYNGWMLAIGGAGLNSQTELVNKPYQEIFCSEDGGTSWHKLKGLRMPDKTLDAAKPTVIVADKSGYFYLISADGGKIYRCKLNNATWDSTEWKVIQ